MTPSASRRSKITRQSPTRSRQSRSGPRSSLTSPFGSAPIAVLIRSRSLRPSRRSAFNAAGRISIRHSSGSVSAQLRLDPRPSYTGFCTCLSNRTQILLGQRLIVIRRRIELGDHGISGAAQQDRSRRQRLVRQSIDQLVKLRLGHVENGSSGAHRNQGRRGRLAGTCQRLPQSLHPRFTVQSSPARVHFAGYKRAGVNQAL
jgi:hypothetical protein